MPKCLKVSLSAVAMVLGATSVATAQIGMVAGQNHTATVFDAATNTVVATVSLPGPNAATGDCVINGTKGYVTDFTGSVHVIDLSVPVPGVIGSIPISQAGEDLTVTPDRKFILSCDGGGASPMSIIDAATDVEVATFSIPCNGVEACSDGSVLALDASGGFVRRLTIDGVGVVTNTFEVVGTGLSMNPACAPGAATGVGFSVFPGNVNSFAIPGLALVDTRLVSPFVAQSGVVRPDGTRLYSRPDLAIDGFSYDSTTGAIGAAPFVSIPLPGGTTAFYGMDQLALHPDGSKLYIPEVDALNVYDAFTGALLASMPLPAGTSATGVCFSPNRAPDCSAAVADQGELWPPNHKLAPIGIGGVTDPDGDLLTITATAVTQDEEVLAKGSGAGNTSPDATLSPLAVRAERNGNPKTPGDGRVYHVSFTADDGKGGSCSGTVSVCVPHDQRPGSACTDGGPLFSSIP